jgi:hypothetical protein
VAASAAAHAPLVLLVVPLLIATRRAHGWRGGPAAGGAR